MTTTMTKVRAVLIAKGIGVFVAILATPAALMYPVLRAAGYIG